MGKFPILCTVGATLLMAGCVSQQRYNESLRRNAELEQEYRQLHQTMSAEIAAHNVRISRMQDAIKVSINSELQFPPGGWEMSDSARTNIAKIAAILAPHQTAKIDVNGYTDSTPIGSGLAKQGVATNLALSQKRAENVVHFMVSQGVNTNLVSAHGFGEARPIASNQTPQGRAQNRRVELTVANRNN